MSQIGVSLDIIEYFPADFNYENFSFIFMPENKEFEQEITFFEKNQIVHKIPFQKKDIKYTVKVTKSSSLIGICDFSIPFSFLCAKETMFDKTCSITMTDSIKRVLFGSKLTDTTKIINLSITIHANIRYIVHNTTINNKINLKNNNITNNKKKKNSNKNLFTPKNYSNSERFLLSSSDLNFHSGNNNKGSNYSSFGIFNKNNESGGTNFMNERYERNGLSNSTSDLTKFKEGEYNINLSSFMKKQRAKSKPKNSEGNNNNHSLKSKSLILPKGKDKEFMKDFNNFRGKNKLSSSIVSNGDNKHKIYLFKSNINNLENVNNIDNNDNNKELNDSSVIDDVLIGKDNISESLNNNEENNIEKNENNKNENSVDKSDNNKDSIQENNYQENKEEKELKNFLNNFFEKYPLDKLNEITDNNSSTPLEQLNEMTLYTKNIIEQLLDYQINFYNLIHKKMSLNSKINSLIKKYTLKQRLMIKKINKAREENNTKNIKTQLAIIKCKNDFHNIKSFLPMKDTELDILKEIYKNKINNLNNNRVIDNNQSQKQMEEKKNLEDKTKNLLLKVLRHLGKKYGSLNKFLTQENSSEIERVNLKTIGKKFGLPISSDETDKTYNINNNSNKKNNDNQSSCNSNYKNLVDEILISNKKEDKSKIEQKIENKNEQRKENFAENEVEKIGQNIEKENEKESDNNNKINCYNNNKEEIENQVQKREENDPEEEGEEDELSKKIEGKWEYIQTNKPDKIDTKLENYLRFFYSKRRFPVIIFKKTSKNNYEYGSQKIMIKIEGDTIRVRYTGGYVLIDKFIEVNSSIEEKKKNVNKNKNMNYALASAGKKKTNYTSTNSSAKKK